MKRALSAAIIIACILAGTKKTFAAPLPVAPGLQHFAITLRYHRAADLDRLIDEQTDPASPLYGKFLTTDEFRSYFAPTQAEYAKTITTLQHLGFTITGTSPNRTVIDVVASPQLVNQTFGTAGRTTMAGGHIAATARRSPSALPLVSGVVSDRTISRGSISHHATHAHGAAPFFGSSDRGRDETVPFRVGPDGGFGPAALSAGLNFPIRHGYDGRGVNVADIVDGHPVDADLQTFLSAFHIRPSGPPTIVPIDGGNGPDPDLADIDSEWILGTAPGAHLYIYEMVVFTSFTFVDALNKIVSDNIVDVANTSLSTCESDTIDLALAIEPILKQGAAQGIAFEVPSFGIQSQCGIPDTLFPVVPADDQDVLAVSGTNAIEDDEGEIVEQRQTAMGNSGGGVSAVVGVIPAQAHLAGVDPSGRNTPDISILTEINGNGPSSFFSGGWNGNFIFVNNISMVGLLAQYQQMTHHRLGAFNRTLYHLFARHGYDDGIVPVIGGCDGSYLGTPLCSKRGYNITTGIGAIGNAYELGRRIRHEGINR